MPPEVGAVERLLEPQDAELGEGIGRAARRHDVERRRRVPGHAPAGVEVDHQLQPVAHGVAHRADGLEPLVDPGAVDPDLHRPEARRRRSRRRTPPARPATRRSPGRGVRGQRIGRAAEQDGHRLAGHLARRGPTARPRAASTGRRGSRSSRARGRGARSAAGPARRTGARTPRTRPSCRPTRSRSRPRRSRPPRASRRRTSAARDPRPRRTAGRAGARGGRSGSA